MMENYGVRNRDMNTDVVEFLIDRFDGDDKEWERSVYQFNLLNYPTRSYFRSYYGILCMILRYTFADDDSE